MLPRLATALLLAVSVTGCVSEDASDAGHALTMSATLTVNADGELEFLSPAASLATHAPADVTGKPYYVGVFPAGFSSGNDPALWQRWGEVPPGLAITETTDPMFEAGAYDMVLVLYVHTPINAAQLAFEESPPAAAGGDLASFNLSNVDVLPGDPDPALGTLRLNVMDADASVEITNRTPTDLADRDQTLAAFERTILIIP